LTTSERNGSDGMANKMTAQIMDRKNVNSDFNIEQLIAHATCASAGGGASSAGNSRATMDDDDGEVVRVVV
jgi:hypothetical protein